ncbi:dihydrolipoyllysine acetyltransferase [Heyndrickxia sporothermodurans]|uniref:Dihydrolipoamide acetyltransferase component of pyruvate dehydrogenase complex n=1 Tax=Heyndrickxia sporothermodurans TaxID=46224 RepID=A0AB37HQR3_9BACI|nr:dihydrolipoamide acetyltransferase family protein [Heyndrickxia sporothermodurans]MBL5767131.1 2-oxo acid dehydrogenase subunit E2 [Heyndrickxia sporothermodurans]MBL5770630.1 2-oxo acid dehydrogenase subunit E2 [Heyndrickxia sporothermodurans]MBL5775512.1 2-oxo acid dehydrogenase subunit E2 [Heyndrickxia sporothermodurans]MBL5778475.1 2-oxo acid dehydrogenase subunit E2 [Heyndrickxia sporothermodurans]MBL5781710.1 2-oxo acid dehydrogenase subunit E2 [Heyndrickxia sporothermodurans]
MVEVKLHDIGEGMTEGEIVSYLVKVGDPVQSDQPLVEVQTDKMTAELPSPTTGIVKEILVKEGTLVPVGTTILIIESGQTKHVQQEVTVSSNRNKVEKTNRLILAAPYTRKIARELGIDIEKINGTGPAGRITDEDVYNYGKKAVEPMAAPIKEVIKNAVESDEIPFKGRRKQIASLMSKSLFTIPHVTHFEEVDMTNLLDCKQQCKEDGINISVAAFFIKAIQLTLMKYPIFNSVLDEDHGVIRLKKEYNIGVAVDAEDGLIVPVIRNVEQKTVKTIHDEMKIAIEKAQNNTLTKADISNGTFTISNVGPLGGIGATPIINYPQTALISFHKTKKKPVVINDEIVIRSMMNLSMSFDHRVADGATAVRFTNEFVQLIENPTRMLLEMT